MPRDSPVRTLADLRGKQVALNKGSHVHFLLVQTLASAELKPGDTKPAYLAPACWRTTWASRPTGGSSARRAPSREQPDALRRLMAELDETDRWAQRNQPEAARMLAASMGLPEPVVARALGRMGYGVQSLNDEVVADQQRIADTFHALKLIPQRINVSEAVWKPDA